MKNCNHCNTPLSDDAPFCHSCGKQVTGIPLSCPQCNVMNVGSEQFCISCGFSFFEKKKKRESYQAEFPLNFRETSTLANDIKDYFFQSFKKRISEEHDTGILNLYSDRFTTFYENRNLDLRTNQLAEEAYFIHQKQVENTEREVDQLLRKNFDNYLDLFIILHCKDLNEIHLPESILAYSEARKGTVDLKKMMLDYLDLENENENYYTDFIIMPLKKLKNASQAFLFPKKDEKIVLIADQTIFGSCKEGFALTEEALYWKAHFASPNRLFFSEIKIIKREKDKLLIDGKYFNVNPSINLKMMKLLKKLRVIFQ